MARDKVDDFIQTLVEVFGDKLGKRAEAVAREIIKELGNGRSPDLAVDIALSRTRIRHFIRDQVTDLMITVTGISHGVSFQAITNKEDLSRFYLDRTWPGENLTLSAKLNKLQWEDEIKGVIQSGLNQGKEFQKQAEDLTDLNLVRGDISKKIPRLLSTAERMVRSRGGSKNDIRDFKKAVGAYESHVKSLSTTSVYQNLRAMGNTLLDQAKSLDIESLNKSIVQAVKDKARYNSMRLAHTESRKAFNLQSINSMTEDEDVVAMKYRLGNYKGHHIDICDFYSRADLWGLGPGVSPKNQINHAPPVHPWCRCSLIPVYGSEVKAGRFDQKAITRYLDSLSKEDRKALLGITGSQEYARDKETWRHHLTGYDGPGFINIGDIVKPEIDPDLVKKYPLDKDLRPLAKP